MDINQLFTDEGMRAFTGTQRDQHMEDARQYGQLADIIRRKLAQTPIEGDRWFSAWWRARKVARQIRAMERASQKAAGSSEALYATYVNQVLELPQRRTQAAIAKADRKQQRTAAAAGFVAKSLEKSVTSLNGTQQETPSQVQEPQYLDAQAFRFPMAVGSEGFTQTQPITDFFPKEGR